MVDCDTAEVGNVDICNLYPDFYEQLLQANDNVVSTYKVKTADDYELTLFRITQSENRNFDDGLAGAPILLHHDGSKDASAWFETNPHSLPVKLFEQGFDVWLTNKRGTLPSRTHVTLDADTNSEYWDFSHKEIALNDLPAFVTGVLE